MSLPHRCSRCVFVAAVLVRARRRYLFKRCDPWIATTILTQGPQFSRCAPVGENCPRNAVLTPKNTNTRCEQMRSCNRFSRVYSPPCASRIVFDALGNDQVQGEHQDKSTQQHRRILHSTRMGYPQVECLKHPKVFLVGEVREST